MELTSNVELVTPEVAKKYLENNSVNRTLRQSNVKQMCELLTNGSFMLTHQGIAFSKEGLLLDGQHRLNAIVKTGISAKMMVSRGYDKETYIAIDGGASRSIVDRTDLNRKTAEITRFFLEYTFSGHYTYKDSKMNMRLADSGIRKLHEELDEYCNRNVRKFSRVQIRAAAIILVLTGHDKDYVFNLYKNLVLMRFSELPVIVHSLIRQADKFKGGRDFDAFVKTLKAFDIKNSNTSRLSITDGDVEDSRKLLKNTILNLLNIKGE